MLRKTLFSVACGLVGALSVAACNIDVPDLNNPGLGDLQNHPNANLDNTAATGMIITTRLDIAGEAGYIDLVGILGREAYNFDAADGRYVTELIEGTLNKSDAYGGNFWLNEYRAVQLGNIIIAGLPQVADFSTDPTTAANDKAAMKGYVETIQAQAFLLIATSHEETGAPVEIPLDPTQLAPFVDLAGVYTKINALLDDANTLLAPLAAQTPAFPFTFPLSSGFNGFSDTAGFLKFNRALRARSAAYTKDYTTALTLLSNGSTFIDDTSAKIDMNNGVYHSFSLTANDTTNGLVNKNIWAHPSLRTGAQMQADGKSLDARFLAKVAPPTDGSSGSSNGLASSDQFTTFSPTSPVSIIRNEDLILLKAEALAGTGDFAKATTELNIVRQQSGNLAPITTTPTTMDAFVNLLLYERQYSLMMEGHRWVDLRRFGQAIPLDRPTDVANLRFPVPQVECDARGTPPQCAILPTGVINGD